jgi:predicted secreted hydrolase
MKSSLLAALLVAAIFPAKADSWKSAEAGYKFDFPGDHFSHPEYETEWWYYTGNLRAQDGHRYGFELTFFRQGSQLTPEAAESESVVWRPDQLYLAHLALSDIDGQSFYHTERLNRAGPGLAGASRSDGRYWNGNWQVRWTALPEAKQELIVVCGRFTLRLTLSPSKAPVVQGQNGVSRKGPLPGEASHYISFTRLQATGDLKEASAVPVSGVAWMDHEFFTEPPDSTISGWDWFAIQLDDNQELMLYRLRDKAGNVTRYSSGSYVDSRGQSRFLTKGDFTLTPGDTWQSSHSKARYPVSWEISVPSLGLELSAVTRLKDQELWSEHSTTPSYWEGAVEYRGKRGNEEISGVGYLEMTGYGRPIRLSGLSGK